MRITLILVCLLAALITLSGCEDPKAKEVRVADDRVNTAIDSGDGATAITLITRDSIERYTRLVVAARTMNRQSLRGLPLSDRLEVLLMRSRLSSGELKDLDGAGYYKLIIKKKLIESTVASGMRAGKVQVKGSTATMEWWEDDADEPSMGFYALEDGQWKEDQVAFAKWHDKQLKQACADQGMTEEELLQEVVESERTSPMPDSLWEPK